MPITPEDRARENIDKFLTAAGWIVQNKKEVNLAAGRGVAVREFPMKSGHGEADYLLFVDSAPIGVVEAKKEGDTLTGVELQTTKYSEGIPANLTAPRRPLPFQYQSTGVETRFTNLLEPDARSQELQGGLPHNATFRQVVQNTEDKFSSLMPRLQDLITAGSMLRDDPFDVLQTFIMFVIIGYDNGNPAVCEVKFYINWDTRTFIKATAQMIRFENRYYVFGTAQAITDILNPNSYAHSQAMTCCLTAVGDLLSGSASLDESIRLGRLLVKIEEKVNPDKVGGEITGVQILPNGNAIELTNPTPLTKGAGGKQKKANKTQK